VRSKDSPPLTIHWHFSLTPTSPGGRGENFYRRSSPIVSVKGKSLYGTAKGVTV
jgi:hypothetical protein